MKTHSLGILANGRKNNLNTIRLLTAILILLYHSFSLLGTHEPFNPFFENSYGRLGIYIFIFISGFLITHSFLNKLNFGKYIWSRCLRIFPLLIVVVFASVFILGPFVTSLPISEYFKTPNTYSYLLNATGFYEQQNLPGVFLNNFKTVVNGPLWVIKYLLIFYLLIGILGITRLLTKHLFILGIFILSLTTTILKLPSSNTYFSFVPYDFTLLFTYFTFGSIVYLYRDKISIRIDILLFVIVLVVIGAIKGGYGETLFVFPLGYLVLFFGYSPDINISFLSKYGDYSYGIYIMSLPIQQTIIHITHGKINTLTLFLISLPICYILAALSWHLIEKRILKFKDSYNNIFHFKLLNL